MTPALSLRQEAPGCDYCRNEPDPGWIETDNNGPIVPCPFCNEDAARDWAASARQEARALQALVERNELRIAKLVKRHGG